MLAQKSLAEIVTLQPSSAVLFERLGIDYCCRGSRTLSQACENLQLSLDSVESELQQLFYVPVLTSGSECPEKMAPGRLAGHIVDTHHRYMKQSMPLIHHHLEKVCKKHGSRHPELTVLLEKFIRLESDMRQHLYKEEHNLFPRIMEIDLAVSSRSGHWIPDKYYIASPIDVVVEEHTETGNLMDEIRNLTNHYTAPADACTTYKLLIHELAEFERDLHMHMHLENNILFPEAIKLQQSISGIRLN
ncbi:MAG: iron-sulfur cluster repair di-iron protein [Bacteroidia bacterium]|nr:iron-sulfur cluster repair di-iron protein [Bacteroidia bacterium]